MTKLSSQDRAALIKLASSLPAGDETRKAILAGLSGTDKTAASERYLVIPSRHWVHAVTGAKASIYGANPWIHPSDKPNWSVETVGWTVEDTKEGTVGRMTGSPWKSKPEAQRWADKENERLAGIAATYSRRSAGGKTAASVMKGNIAADYAKGNSEAGLSEFRKAVRKYALVKAREFAHAANAGLDPYSEGAQDTRWLFDDLFIESSSVHGDYVIFNIQDGQSDLTVTLKLGTYESQVG